MMLCDGVAIVWEVFNIVYACVDLLNGYSSVWIDWNTRIVRKISMHAKTMFYRWHVICSKMTVYN